MLFTSGSPRQEAAQWPQASAQELQASMQEWNCSWGMADLLDWTLALEQEVSALVKLIAG